MRRKNCQLIIVVWIALTIILTIYYNYRISESRNPPSWVFEYDEKLIPPTDLPSSTWECSGEGRSRVCIINNFCIDKSSGGFLIGERTSEAVDELTVNVINAAEEDDIYYTPQFRLQAELSDEKIAYLDETVFVYGTFSAEHFSHMLFNGLIPLYQNMKNYNGTKKSWTYRAGAAVRMKHLGQPLFVTDFLVNGKDMVRHDYQLTSDQQVLLPKAPICFSRAVVGNGGTSSLSFYSARPITADSYASFRDLAIDFYVDHAMWKSSVQYHSGRKDAGRQDFACVESMKLTTIPGNTPQKIIGIINRKGRRHIGNIPELIAAIQENAQKTGRAYLIKEISFDEGCSLGSVVFLVHDIDMLITPNGSQDGAAVFMKDNSVVINVYARGHWEDWFSYPLTAMGRRSFTFNCYSADCVVTDVALAKEEWAIRGVKLPSDSAVQECASWKDDISIADCLTRYMEASQNPWDEAASKLAADDYAKDAPRLIDVERFIPFFERTVDEMDEFEKVGASFIDICNQEKCCGPDCKHVLDAVVYGTTFDGKMKAWTQNTAKQPKGNWVEN